MGRTELPSFCRTVLEKGLPKFLQNPEPEVFKYGNGLVLDLETSVLDFGTPHNGKNRLLCACWWYKGKAYQSWGNEDQQRLLAEQVKEADFIVAHNCFSADTKYITSNGLKALGESSGTEQTVWTKDGWRSAHIKEYGEEELYEVELVPYNRSRSTIKRKIKATASHRWIAERIVYRNQKPRRRWTSINNSTTATLRKGDRLPAQAPLPTLSKGDGFRHGLIFADGSLNSKQPKHTGFFTHQLSLHGWKEIYKDLFPKYTYPASNSGEPVINYWAHRVNCKQVPSITESNTYIAEFIEGWIALDGTDASNGTNNARIAQTINKDAADWLELNAEIAGYVVTGRSYYDHKKEAGAKSDCRLYTLVLTRPEDTAWTVNAVSKLKGKQKVYCAEVIDGPDEFTLASGVYTKNCKFELGWLKRIGIDLRELIVWDTMLAEWILNGNIKRGLSLSDCCKRHGIEQKKDIIGDWIRKGIDTDNIPKSWLIEYCSIDVSMTRKLFARQLVKVQEQGQLHLVYQRGLVCACLTDIEFNGLCLDEERVNHEYNQVLKEYIAAKKALEKYGSEINWRSRKQVAELLYDKLGFKECCDRRGNPRRTETGDRAVDKSAISSLIAKTKTQREFVELYKQVANLNAKLTKTLDFFKGVCSNYGGIFYGSFNHCHTGTHRLSSSGRSITLINADTQKETKKGIQLQNIPREYKKLITTKRKDWVIIEADASQIEFRIAADLGKDVVAQKEIRDGVDIHMNTVEAFAAAGEIITRQEAKPQTFKPTFGGTGKTDAEKAYCKFFQNKYSGIFKTQTGWTHEVLKTGQLITSYGMRFFWPNTKISRSGYIDNTTAIYNYPIQGLSTGELIPLIVVEVWHLTKHLRCEIVCTVHDSVILEVHPDDVEEVKAILVRCFTKDIYTLMEKIYSYEIKTRLGCEIKCSKNWGEGKGEKSEAILRDPF